MHAPILTRGYPERVGALLVVAVAACSAWTEFGDGDLGFHLATGREVLATGRIPLTNVLSYTNTEHPWHLHQWLPGVLFELANRAGGALALQLVRVLLVALTWFTVYAAALATGATAVAAVLASLLAISAAAFRFELRPYLFTHLSLGAVTLFAAQFLRARAGSDEVGTRRALALAGLMPVLACHLHAGVIDSWLLLIALAVACLAEPLRESLLGLPASARGCASAVWLTLFASLSLATLSLAAYHPLGARILLVPFDMGSDAYLAEHLVEFRPPSAFPLAPLAAYWGLLGASVLLLVLRARSTASFWMAAVAGFLLLSLKHVRLVYGFSVVASPFLAQAITPYLARVRKRVLLPLASAIAVLVIAARIEANPMRTGFSARVWPPHLFDYVARHGLLGPAFVSDAWAAPMLGRFYPEHRAFFDNRFEAYPRAFFREVYQKIRYGRPGWDALLDRYGVQLALMRYTTEGEARFQKGAPNVRQHLSRDSRWALVTFDDLGELFVRVNGRYAAHAASFAIPRIDPDALTFRSAPRESVAPLRRELARGNGSTRLKLLAAIAEHDAGNTARATQLVQQAKASAEATMLLTRLRAQLGKPVTER